MKNPGCVIKITKCRSEKKKEEELNIAVRNVASTLDAKVST